MRLPDTALESVVFLCVKTTSDGVERYVIGGTAFFIGVPSETDPHVNYIYAVTAKHCIEAARGYGNLFIRINTKECTEYIAVDPYAWSYPPDDDAADVAVALAAPPSDYFKYLYVPSELIATEEVIKAKQIGVGEDIAVVGLHASRHGRGRNLPVVRTGIISCMPHKDEPLQDEKSGLDYHAFLVELHSIGGLSGSPVFAILGQGRLTAKELGGRLHKGFLIGLIRGHFHTTVPVLGYDRHDLEKLNEGMAIVTPIQEALNLINAEEVVKVRRKIDKARSQGDSATTKDSAFGEGKEAEQPFMLTKEGFEEVLRRASRKTSSQPESESDET